VNDAAILLRSIVGDAATTTASKINPSEDQLHQVDEAAPDNTWHDTPDFANVKSQMSQRWNENKPFGKKDVDKAVGDASAAAHPESSRDPADVANAAATEQQTGQPQDIDAAAGVQAGVSQLQNAASDNVSDDTKNKGREYRERTMNYLKGKMPKERREQTIWRLKKMIVEIQGHKDCTCCLPERSLYILTDTPQINKQSRHCSPLRRHTAVMPELSPPKARVPSRTSAVTTP